MRGSQGDYKAKMGFEKRHYHKSKSPHFAQVRPHAPLGSAVNDLDEDVLTARGIDPRNRFAVGCAACGFIREKYGCFSKAPDVGV
jgi:hypothetical protein